MVQGLRVVALGAACLAAWSVGCGASWRTLDDDDAGSAGDGVAAQKSGGSGGRAGRGTSSGGRANGGATAIGGTGLTGGANASAGTSNAQGGNGGAGGGGGHAGSAGKSGAGTGADGSVGGEDGSGGALDGSGGMGGECDWPNVTAKAPTVVLLIDTSTSMWEVMPPAWNIVHDGLMYPDPSLGVVAALASHVRFGFASYKGYQAASEDDPACATMATVAPALDNFAAVDLVFGGIGYDENARWETPTNYAINFTAAALVADTEAPGDKFILLFTDGNPNTCRVVDPQCGQDLSVRAAQDAFANGIGLRVVGLGDVIADPNSGCPSSARCGEEHLQDLANAGVGAPVAPPPNCDDPTSGSCAYRFEACVEDNVLQASYTPGAADVGTPGLLQSTSLDSRPAFVDLVTGIVRALIPCTFELGPDWDPSAGTVTIGNNVALIQGDADGFELEGTELKLKGAACDAYRSGEDIGVRGACGDNR